MADPTGQKRCSRCKEFISLDQFRRDRSNKDGLSGWCKACWKEFRASLDYDVDPMVFEKRCSRCKSVQPVGQFNAYRKSRDGLGSWCKSCTSEHNRVRSAKLNYDIDPTICEKYCSRCQETKPVGEFDRSRRSRDGLQPRCSACMKEVNRDWYQRNKDKAAEWRKTWVANNPEKAKAAGRKGHLKKMYGLTPKDVEQLRQEQDDKCAGCGDPFDGTVPHVDHDHKTGAVRGLLCGNCNRALGMVLDSPERLLGLVRYLGRYGVMVSVGVGDPQPADTVDNGKG